MSHIFEERGPLRTFLSKRLPHIPTQPNGIWKYLFENTSIYNITAALAVDREFFLICLIFWVAWAPFASFWLPLGCPWDALGLLWHALGSPWDALGLLWGALGLPWNALWLLWGALGPLCGSSIAPEHKI